MGVSKLCLGCAKLVTFERMRSSTGVFEIVAMAVKLRRDNKDGLIVGIEEE